MVEWYIKQQIEEFNLSQKLADAIAIGEYLAPAVIVTILVVAVSMILFTKE